MKKLIFIFALLFTLILSACDPIEDEPQADLEYSDLAAKALFTHVEAESKSNDKYVVYYYQEACSHCQSVKQDILAFALDFEYLDFYIIDSSKTPDSSSYEEFRGTPTIFVLSGGEIIESYIGSVQVLDFIDLYSEIQFEYDMFEAQQLNSYSEILEIEEDEYLVYYYLESCPNCIAVKDQFLQWAFSKNVNEFYIMNGATIENPDEIPTELQILASGTPLLIVMSNGVFTDEYYLGKDTILDYID
jgi:thiol-disulfide isomerase/thioredoxin